MQNLSSVEIDSSWKRESIRIRAHQSKSALGTACIMSLVLLFSLHSYLPLNVLLMWLSGIIATLIWRFNVSRKVLHQFDVRPNSAFHWADKQLRYCSILTQLSVGLGVALCWGEAAMQVAYIITAAQLLHGIACMINLSYDYKSFKYSLPMLMAPPFIFWVIKEGQGTIIAASILMLSYLMLSLVRRSEDSLKETFKMRFENLFLLQQVETERSKTEEALEIAQKANQARAFFMAAASHDLRQPLFALSILTDTLGLQKLPETARPIFAKQQSAIKALRSLFDNLLDLSKFDSGQINPRLEDIPLQSILDPLDEEFATVCGKRGIGWTLEFPEIAVNTDPELLQRVIRNLLTNATNFTDEGGISLKVDYVDDRARFVIADTGCGIAESDQQRVFDDFVQLRNRNRLRSKGVGLGLAITKHINQLLGLNLSMSSQLGKGTAFCFECPASMLIMSPAKEASVQLSPDLIKGLSVWVFENEPLVRVALAHQFEAWQCPAELFSSKTDYQQQLTQNPSLASALPDLLILDDMLGDNESGLEIAEEFEPRIGARRILLMTGNSDPERLNTLENSPFNYARKPVAADWLIYWMMTASHAEKTTPSVVSGHS